MFAYVFMSLLWNVAARIHISLHCTSPGQEALNQDLDPSIRDNLRRHNVPLLINMLPVVVTPCLYFIWVKVFAADIFESKFLLFEGKLAFGLASFMFKIRPIWQHVKKTARQKIKQIFTNRTASPCTRVIEMYETTSSLPSYILVVSCELKRLGKATAFNYGFPHSVLERI